MYARSFPARVRSNLHRAPRLIPVMLLAATLVSLSPSRALCLAASDSGRWTPPQRWFETAIHMALLPGASPIHSEVMWWQGLGDEDAELYGGLWRWQPGDYDCGSFPDTSVLAPLDFPLPDSSGMFCSSESQMADPHGRLFLAGGTQLGTENGIRLAYTFDPFTNTWARVDSMSQARWYASSTTLTTGEQLVLSGSHDLWINFFGGRRNAEPVPRDKAVFRYGLGENGHADDPVRSGSGTDWPSPREGHTAVLVGLYSTFLFGGKDSTSDQPGGDYFDEYWQLGRGPNTFGTDFDYRWTPYNITTTKPRGRWDHTAVPTPDTLAPMIIFGGIRKNPSTHQDEVVDEVWRLHFASDQGGWRWNQVFPTGPSPGPRCGHVAMWRASDRRMLVFGGRSTPTGAPSDSALYSLQFDPTYTSATWQTLAAVGPGPRFHHALGWDSGLAQSEAYLFGGEIGGGTQLGDLWRLNADVPDAGSITWEAITDLPGPAPSPRSRHTATLIGIPNLLYVFGGRSDDSTVYVAHLEPVAPHELRTWTTYRAHNPALSGHTAVREGVRWARIPEIFDPTAASGTQWTRLDGAPHLQNWYPQTFTTGPDSVFVSGPDEKSYYLKLSTPGWSQFPTTSSGFLGGSAVMYRPGKVMKCGSRDIELGTSAPAAGTTKRIDLNLGNSASWDTSANQMLPRVNHNLVLLPTGKVLVVGGTTVNDGAPLSAAKRPELWDPDAAGGSGAWFGRDTLAAEGLIRDYHSTALLLPDARVLCAGGSADSGAMRCAEIYCPPYLFKAGTANLAVRPAVNGAPSAITWGKPFFLAVPNRSSLTRAALIRPAAVTHGFDQNQRYVPLSYGYADDPTRITVTGPASPGAAPPGHYLLFLTGSGDGPDVPSVARWVRIPTGAGTDTCDRLPPAVLADLAVDAVSTNTAVLTWSATADDSDFATSGAAQEFDLRRSASQINSEAAWGVSTLITGLPTPGEPTTPHDKTVTGLQPCTNYEFAVRARDHNFNQSLLHPRVHVVTLCGGGGGGGYAARQAGAGTAMASAALASTAATSALQPAPGALIVETSRSASGGWRIVVRGESGAEGLGAADSSGLVFQDRDPVGAWRTRAGYRPSSADPSIGLCALRDHGRTVMPGSYQFQQVAPAIRSGGASYSLTAATHSALGDLSASLAAGSGVMVAQGDSLVLGYEASADTAAQDWYALVANGGGAIVPLRAREMAASEALPLRFALHQNQPNPFAARTTIRFDLPVGAMVRLEVYDLLGRRVSTLANHYYPPGYQSVDWDPRPAAGPGVYFYRLEAGPFRDRRKMVLLP